MTGHGRLASLRISKRLVVLAAIFVALVAVAWFYRGQIALSYQLQAARRAIQARDFALAVKALDKAQAAGSHSAQWQFFRARATRRAGRLDEAQTHLSRASELGWNKADIERERLLLTAQSGRINEVRPQLESLLQSEIPDDVAEEIYEAMAKGFLTSFDIPEASRCLKFWSEFQPDNPLPHVFTADLCERLENPSGAAQEFAKAIELDPDRTDVRLRLAQALLIQLKLDEATHHFQLCLAELPDSPAALLSLSDISRRRGRVEDAKSYLYDTLILDLRPDQAADALTALGQMALEEQHPEAAIQMLEQSVTIAPKVSASRMALAAALTAGGHEELAASHRELGIKLRDQNDRHKLLVRRVAAEPKNADVRTEVGLNLMDQGLLGPGAGWLETALRIDPAHPGANRGLADYYEQIGQPQQAQEHRRRAEQPKAARAGGPSSRGEASSN